MSFEQGAMEAMKIEQKTMMKKIISKSLTLYDHLDGGLYQNIEMNRQIATLRLKRWGQNIGDSNENNLEKRLSWDNLDFNSAINLLGAAKINISPKPSWVVIFEECLKAIREFQYTNANIFNNTQEQSLKSVIQYLFTPIAKYARLMVAKSCL